MNVRRVGPSVWLAWLVLAGCDGPRTCEELCEQGQAGDCVGVFGACSGFCEALDALEVAAGCVEERTAYEACLDDEPYVCDSDCSGRESALSTCIRAYCSNNAGNADCETIRNSLF